MRTRIGVVFGAAALSIVTGCTEGAEGDDESTGDQGQSVTTVAAPGNPVQSAAEVARMDAYLRNRIDPASVVVTLQTKGGRRVDCVDINQQPAFRNPQLRGLKIATPPKLLDARAPEAETSTPVVPEALFALGGQTQSLCPGGTVPIPEVTRADLSRFSSLDEFFAKDRGPTEAPISEAAPASDAFAPPHVGPTALHQYAHARRNVTNWGAETSISIPSLTTELNSEFSLGQIWVVAGAGSGLQTLEGGIQHYRDL